MRSLEVSSLDSRYSCRKLNIRIWMIRYKRNSSYVRSWSDWQSSSKKRRKTMVSRCIRCSRFRRCSRKSM